MSRASRGLTPEQVAAQALGVDVTRFRIHLSGATGFFTAYRSFTAELDALRTP